MVVPTTFNFKEYLALKRQLVETRLAEFLEDDDLPLLWESMRYSVLSGGKRLRALLCLAAAEAVMPSSTELVLPCACAIELVHAMSLIHDDLPAMDNDELRRGRPTNHKVYGEAMALLAGDALLTLASEILIAKTPASVPPERLLLVAGALNHAAGAKGMVGGQVEDLRFTGLADSATKQVTPAMLESMHRRKTGALLRFSVWSGACLAGLSGEQLTALTTFGEALGLAFQIKDDLLDVTGDANTLGKTPGKDEAAKKVTWVSLFGIEGSKAKLVVLADQAQNELVRTGLSEESLIPLQSLLDYALYRFN
ncbi:MAG: polyprenyl synthetase family protein [Candidatus Melainabacteria bacterium]|nr:polyprenyl synthetase family protein [Candidatus Melainabacteria bacterium]